jgi:hypothetical protein
MEIIKMTKAKYRELIVMMKDEKGPGRLCMLLNATHDKLIVIDAVDIPECGIDTVEGWRSRIKSIKISDIDVMFERTV